MKKIIIKSISFFIGAFFMFSFILGVAAFMEPTVSYTTSINYMHSQSQLLVINNKIDSFNETVTNGLEDIVTEIQLVKDKINN